MYQPCSFSPFEKKPHSAPDNTQSYFIILEVKFHENLNTQFLREGCYKGPVSLPSSLYKRLIVLFKPIRLSKKKKKRMIGYHEGQACGYSSIVFYKLSHTWYQISNNDQISNMERAKHSFLLCPNPLSCLVMIKICLNQISNNTSLFCLMIPGLSKDIWCHV